MAGFLKARGKERKKADPTGFEEAENGRATAVFMTTMAAMNVPSSVMGHTTTTVSGKN